MLEIVFNESAAGSLRGAKTANHFPGSPEDVLCLPFMLDIGDISQPVDSEYRKNLMSFPDKYLGWDIPDAETEQRWQQAVDANKRLLASAKNGEPIRIWYSDTPYSLCGLYYVCHLLQLYTAPVSVVKMPESIRQEDGCLVSYTGWYAVSPDLWEGFLSYSQDLHPIEVRSYAWMWRDLLKDNSPLRAIVNGTLVGVPEDFYDFLLYKSLSKEPVKQARVIGDTIGYYHGGVSDWIYAVRIDRLIADGKIKLVQDAERKYERWISLP